MLRLLGATNVLMHETIRITNMAITDTFKGQCDDVLFICHIYQVIFEEKNFQGYISPLYISQIKFRGSTTLP